MSTISRKDLANVIEQAVRADVDARLWAQIMVNHYPDAAMEHARRECVRIMLKANGDPSQVTDQDAEHLQRLAAALLTPEDEQRNP